MPFLAIDFDVTARLLDETIDHAQAQACPLANALGGEKRLENLLANCLWNATTGIAYRNHHVIAGSNVNIRIDIVLVENDIARFKRQLAAVRHRVARVYSEVKKRCG